VQCAAEMRLTGCPDELKADGDSVSGGAVNVLRSVDGDGGLGEEGCKHRKKALNWVKEEREERRRGIGLPVSPSPSPTAAKTTLTMSSPIVISH
jgi:hypothetical protein